MKKILTIAGFDNSCGAGLQMDIKVFRKFSLYGLSVATSITAQNQNGVIYAKSVSLETFKKQLKSLKKLKVDTVKIGMIPNKKILKELIIFLKKKKFKNIIIDTVLCSTDGYSLMQKNIYDIYIKKLLTISTLITPNINEAQILSGIKIQNKKDMKKAAKILKKKGIKNILLKGGHIKGDPIDLLYGKKYSFFLKGKRAIKVEVHGTGCAFSSAVAANLAKGKSLKKSVKKSKKFISKAIKNSIKISKKGYRYINV